MSSSQDPTPPTTGGPLRPGGSDVWHRPMTWIYAGLVLAWTVLFIVIWINRPPSSAISPRSLLKAVVFLWALSMFVMYAVRGALLALRHPRGAADRLLVERRYAHPRLQGLAMMWAGLVLSGSISALLFVADPFSSLADGANWWIVAGLVTFAPLIALALFDRPR